MNLNVDADVGGDAEADGNGAFLNLFGKLTASIDSLAATIDKQMKREQWLLSHVPVSIPVTGSTLNGDVTRIVDFGGPQPGREWVIRLLTANTDAMVTIANILTPLSVIIVAVLAYLRSKNTQKKLEHITVVVNQRYTDLENYVIALKKDIVASGREVPDDQSKG